MSLLEAKVIQTQLEKEIYIDDEAHLGFLNFDFNNDPLPTLRFLVKLNLGRVRDNKFYGLEDVYFGIKLVQNEPTIHVFKTKQRSLFAAKNDQEKKAAAELINYLLIDSSNFKQVLMQCIDEQKTQIGNTGLELIEKLKNIKQNNLKFEF